MPILLTIVGTVVLLGVGGFLVLRGREADRAEPDAARPVGPAVVGLRAGVAGSGWLRNQRWPNGSWKTASRPIGGLSSGPRSSLRSARLHPVGSAASTSDTVRCSVTALPRAGSGGCDACHVERVGHHPAGSVDGQLAVPDAPVVHDDRVDGHLGAEVLAVPLDRGARVGHADVRGSAHSIVVLLSLFLDAAPGHGHALPRSRREAAGDDEALVAAQHERRPARPRRRPRAARAARAVPASRSAAPSGPGAPRGRSGCRRRRRGAGSGRGRRTKRSGSAKTAGSRLAAPSRAATFSPRADRDAVELDVGRRGALEEVQRRVVPQHLLDERGRRGRVVVERRRARRSRWARLGEERGEAVAEAVDAGLVARVEQQHDGRDELARREPVTAVALLHERGEQVVARVRSARSAASRSTYAANSSHARCAFRWACSSGSTSYILTMACDQSRSSFQSAVGRAEQLADDEDRAAAPRSVAMTSTRPSRSRTRSTSSSRAAATSSTRGRSRVDVATGEGARDEPAQPRVLRRLRVEDRVGVQPVERRPRVVATGARGRRMRPSRRSRSTSLAAACVVVTHRPEALVPQDRCLLARHGERRVGVGDESGVGQVEGRARHGHRAHASTLPHRSHGRAEGPHGIRHGSGP